jgi:5-methyltetrahydrofolate--homocysteine methyltransferase
LPSGVPTIASNGDRSENGDYIYGKTRLREIDLSRIEQLATSGDGNDLVIWADEGRGQELARFSYPRQQKAPYLCIADFFRPITSDDVDYAGFSIVTMGPAVSERTAKLFADDRYQEYLLLHGLGVEMAEALAEYWHQRIRQELGIAGDDAADMEELFDQGYRGSRYSFGYPACPDLEDRAALVALLRPERIGVSLSEELQLHPEQSTDALVVHHPEAKYFNAR